jgi:tRNA(Ile)-lysidine synthetase-like protein
VSDLIQPFRRALADLASPGDRLVVAVSGGADSLALLDLAARAAPGRRLSLVVAHVDHGWRPDAGDDARFVAAAAAGRGLPFRLAEPRGLARTEAAARAARLACLAAVARAEGAAGVLLGHTADDQAETVVLHLLRGSGVDGLAAMRPSTTLEVDGGRLRLLRPLLAVARAATGEYCRARGLEPRDDPSNDDPGFLRNRVRGEVLPLLRALQPRAVEALARLADLAADEASIVAAAVEPALAALVEPVEGGRSLDRVGFRGLAPAVQRALLRRLARELLGTSNEVSLERVEAARRALLTGRGGAVLEWPGPLRITLAGRRATFAREA